MTRELLDNEDYAPLVTSNYVQSRLQTGSDTKTKVCIAESGKPMFLESVDRIEIIDIPRGQRKTFDDCCLRFFEFRHFSLERAIVDEGLTAFDRRLARLMLKFNGYAIAQTRSGLYSL